MLRLLLMAFACSLLFACEQAQESSKKPTSPLDTAQNQELFLLDMVHYNPGETDLDTRFTNPEFVADLGYDGTIINDFSFIHATVSFEEWAPNLFPKGSPQRQWQDSLTRHIRQTIDELKTAGLEAIFFIDLMILPKKLAEQYPEKLLTGKGKLTITTPFSKKVHRLMFRELFRKYPDLDGLMVRTGETYLHMLPHHTGNGLQYGKASYRQLIKLLREEVCVRAGKKLYHRTWGFDGFQNHPDFYRAVTDSIQPHPKLFFSIKHTKGDFQRLYPRNPTLNIGNHRQIIEVQCQREYEGKGAHPNYIPRGVIHGFPAEHQRGDSGIAELIRADNSQIAGINTWSRGGGWKGPYIPHELWPELNARVMAKWAQQPQKSEAEVFPEVAGNMGFPQSSIEPLRKLCLTTEEAVVLGRLSRHISINPFYFRDHFFGGIWTPGQDTTAHDRWDKLTPIFKKAIRKGLKDSLLAEKRKSLALWDSIVQLSEQIEHPNPETEKFVRVSSRYGFHKYRIVLQSWIVMLNGLEMDLKGPNDTARQALRKAYRAYRAAWKNYRQLKNTNPETCATLYKPYNFMFDGSAYHRNWGVGTAVEYYSQQYGP